MGSFTTEWNNKRSKNKLMEIHLDGMTIEKAIEVLTNLKNQYGTDTYIDFETEYGYYGDVSHTYWLRRK